MATPSAGNKQGYDDAGCPNEPINRSFNNNGNLLLVMGAWYGCSGEWVNQPSWAYAGQAMTTAHNLQTGWSNKSGIAYKFNPAQGTNNITMYNPGSYGARNTVVGVSIKDAFTIPQTGTGTLTVTLNQAGGKDLSVAFIGSGGSSTWTNLAGQTTLVYRHGADRSYHASYELNEDVIGWTGNSIICGAFLVRGCNPGNQIIWWQFRRLSEELRRGLLPTRDLQEKWRELLEAMRPKSPVITNVQIWSD